MTRILRHAILAALLLQAIPTSAPAQSPEVLLEDALYRETAAADADGAIEAYEAVLRAPRVPPRVAARAHLRLGICYYWRGDAQLSRQHLETVAASFTAESDLVRTARRYLGQPAMDDPSSFFPEDILLYVELLDPRANIRGLSALLEGTPFQNPVDYYISSLARAASSGTGSAEAVHAPSGPRQTFVREAAAFLNEGFLREMQLVESLAVGLPGDGKAESDFLAVLDPGASNILRGTVQMGLTISGAAPVGTARDAAIFRLPPPREGILSEPEEGQHVALGSGVVMLGKPQKLVEDGVERGANRMPTLADSGEFQRAKARGAGGIAFAYIGARRLADVARGNLASKDLPAFDAVTKALGFDRVRSAGISLSRLESADELRLEVRMRIEAKDHPAWEALAASPLSGEALRAIPAESLAYLSTRFDGASDRIESVYRAIAPILDVLRSDPHAAVLENIESLHQFLRDGPAMALIGEIEGVTIAIEPEPPGDPGGSVLVALSLRDAEAGAAAIEKALTAVFERFFKNAASRSFADETISVDGHDSRARYVEPAPGVRLRYVRLGRTFAISPSSSAIAAAIRVHADGKNAGRDPIPADAGKLVVLRPAAIVERFRGQEKMPDELALVLGEIERVIISTREDKEGLVLDVTVPGITPTTRSILNKVAEKLAKKRGSGAASAK